MQTVSRRQAIKASLTATVAAAMSGCDWFGTPARKVNVICGGMLGYYCMPGGKGLRILVPQPKTHEGKLCHLVRFGGIGGDPLLNGDYTLSLGSYQASGMSGVSARSSNVIFSKDTQGQAPFDLNPVGIYASIDVPMPVSIDTTRCIHKADGQTQKPFFSGPDAKSFNINPNFFPGVYVLRYGLVSGPVNLQSTRNLPPITFSHQSGGILNIHVYCEPPSGAPNEDHIELFNAMFFHHGTTQQLSLRHTKDDADGTLVCWKEDHVPDGLSRPDIASLAELRITADSRPSKLPAGDGPCAKITDIAGCVDGWIDAS